MPQNKKVFIIYLILMFIIGGIVGHSLARIGGSKYKHEGSGMTHTENEPKGKLSGTMEWQDYTFGNIKFKYPADWKVEVTPVTNPELGPIALSITPVSPMAQGDYIGLSNEKFTCAMFSNSKIKCT